MGVVCRQSFLVVTFMMGLMVQVGEFIGYFLNLKKIKIMSSLLMTRARNFASTKLVDICQP